MSRDATFSPDGRWLVSASWKNSAIRKADKFVTYGRGKYFVLISRLITEVWIEIGRKM